MANLKIVINRRMAIKRCRSKEQGCIFCGNLIGNNLAYTFSNRGDTLILKKNLWLHLRCVDDFCKALKQAYRKNERQIVANEI